MHSTLSVFETLMFSARFRLPAAATRRQRVLAVERAITVLQVGGSSTQVGMARAMLPEEGLCPLNVLSAWC